MNKLTKANKSNTALNTASSADDVLHASRKSEIQIIRQKFVAKRSSGSKDEIEPFPAVSLPIDLYELELLDFESFLDEELEQRGVYVYGGDKGETVLKIEMLSSFVDKMEIAYPKDYKGPLWDKLYHLITPVKTDQDLIMFYKEKIYAWVCLRDLHRTLLDVPSSYVVLNTSTFNQPLLLKSSQTYLTDWIYWRETQSLSGGIILMNCQHYEQLVVASIFKLKYQNDYVYRDKSMENITATYSPDDMGILEHAECMERISSEKLSCEQPSACLNAPVNDNENSFLEQRPNCSGSSECPRLTVTAGDEPPPALDVLDDSSSSSEDDLYYTPSTSLTQLPIPTQKKRNRNSLTNLQLESAQSPTMDMLINRLSVDQLDRSALLKNSDFGKDSYNYKGGTLIVCHLSSVKTWETEAMRKLNVISLTEALPADWDLSQVCSYEVIILACELLQAEKFDWGQFLTATWTRIIVDDALSLCNEQNIWYNICLLNSYANFAVTDVPLQEFHVELLNIFRFLKWPAWNFSKIWSMLITENESLSEQLHMVLEPVVLNFNEISKLHKRRMS